MSSFYKRHFLHVELAAVVLCGVTFVLWNRYGEGQVEVSAILKGNRAAVYGAVASICGSLLGFIITTASLILSFAAADSLRVVRNSGHYGTLWQVFFTAIWWLAWATVVALVALIIDRDEAPKMYMTEAVVVTTFGVFARVARSIWVLENVVKIVVQRTGSGTASRAPASHK